MKLTIVSSMFTVAGWAKVCLAMGLNPMEVKVMEGDFMIPGEEPQQELTGYTTKDNDMPYMCTGCAFDGADDCNDKACTHSERDDGRSIIFELQGDIMWECPNYSQLTGYEHANCHTCKAPQPVKGK